jgi:hypothetical protein
MYDINNEDDLLRELVSNKSQAHYYLECTPEEIDNKIKELNITEIHSCIVGGILVVAKSLEELEDKIEKEIKCRKCIKL